MTALALLALPLRLIRLLQWRPRARAISEQHAEAEADAFVSAIHGARDDEWAYLAPAFEQFPSTAFRSSFEPPWEPAEPPAHPAPTMVPFGEVAEEGDPHEQDLCETCWHDGHCDGAVDWCNCTCTFPEDWADREPEPVPVPDPRPAWVQEIEPHADTDDAVDSILHRVLTPDVLAMLDAAKAAEVTP